MNPETAIKVLVQIFANRGDALNQRNAIAEYVIDHDDDVQRRTLGEQCRYAFEARQVVITQRVTRA